PSNPDKSRQIQSLLLARIEQVLFELTEARRLHDKIVADTNRLMESVLAEVYPTNDEQLPEGWKLLPLSGICTINPTRPRNLSQSDVTMTSFIPMAAVDDREGRIMDLQARPFGEIKRGYTYFEENDVLFAKITPCMENGKAAIARGLINGFGFGSTEFHVLRPTDSILPEWIYYFIRRETFRQEAKTKFRGAVGQQRVPADFLENHLIPVPFPQNPGKSLNIQQQIITRVQMTASEVAEAQLGNAKTGTLLNQMEQSILAQAFRGEL
ncbi:MAG TPA: restriction endonuclease subunit S, partial [Anaerolineales bacterium]|nr:restriction endonuclease subunit S [Anaerolineales bacterium]